MSAGDGYALDLATPVRHVATELDRAAPAALSLGQLAATYRHPIPADLTRIRQHEGVKTSDDAVALLIRRAVEALDGQLVSSDEGLRLAKPFDKLRYERHKIVRLVEQDANDERRGLLAVYADLREDRIFYVTVGTKERRNKLHPLAREIPQGSEKEFLELSADIKRNGVKMPIVVFDKQVLDGRHRVAIASALKIPVRVDEFKGTAEEARDHVVSLNVMRRHLTVAQRGLIVRELDLPQAKIEAAERREQTQGRPSETERAKALSLEKAKATEIAAERSSGLANVRTIETLAPVDQAPKTKERIRSGEIKNAAEARREALKEIGSDEPEAVPKHHSNTAWRALGHSLRWAGEACESLQQGERGDVTDAEIRGRIAEIREQLDRAEILAHKKGGRV